ncbi:unnamed protein product [Blepharisma stoltei]|uniref:Histone deacetylase n=1 Tax=Blepharisma stoltei TaxID=1481888 RepID=A0AAU9KAN5_9CILI|nr:unnamed protein product [Blepharisma stoltei]
MKVLYYFDDQIGNFIYGLGHPMKPHRVKMCHSLLQNYGMLDQLEVIDGTAVPVTIEEDLSYFHTEDYIDFLKTVTPDNLNDYLDLFIGFNMGEDCPIFEGLWDFCKLTTSGSIIGANAINEGRNHIAVNWSGGFHHAKQQEASGFCYINDCVLSSLELLKNHYRVLYIDIDIHHGDGVEEAFYTTNRVMTCSFHKFGNYFPDTGNFNDTGHGIGDGYSVNVPLSEGMDDDSYIMIFKPVIATIMETYDPEVIILQSGADSLSGDRLGCFNLSIKGHGACVEYVKSFGKPVLLIGGGGYTLRNVSRCWAYETGIVCGRELDFKLPDWDEYLGYYGPDFSLIPSISNMENQNSKEYLRHSAERVVTMLKEKVSAVSPTISNYTETPFYNTPNPRYSNDSLQKKKDLDMERED